MHCASNQKIRQCYMCLSKAVTAMVKTTTLLMTGIGDVPVRDWCSWGGRHSAAGRSAGAAVPGQLFGPLDHEENPRATIAMVRAFLSSP